MSLVSDEKLFFDNLSVIFRLIILKKLACTKFQLDRSFRPEVIKENVNSKWRILVPIRYFAQIFK